MTGLDDLAIILVAVAYTMIGFLLGIIYAGLLEDESHEKTG